MHTSHKNNTVNEKMKLEGNMNGLVKMIYTVEGYQGVRIMWWGRSTDLSQYRRGMDRRPQCTKVIIYLTSY